MIRRIKTFPVEALIWAASLFILAFHNPEGGMHFSICPLSNLGFDFCPGCGLGRSISFLFRGQIKQSFAAHPLGIFAVIVLSYRIFRLTQNYLNLYGKSN
jgi:hypothetical protein